MSDTRIKLYSGTTCGYCNGRVPKGHECAAKAEALKERTCLLATCGKLFKPTVHGQGYCSMAHKRTARSQRDRASRHRREAASGKRTWPEKGFKTEINTIAPLERTWARAEKQAAQYAPVMGEELYEITMKLMRTT